MPLFKGKSKKDFAHNVKEEIGEGKSPKQSIAIAYSMKKKKASGGTVESGDSEMNYADGGAVKSPLEMDEVECPSCQHKFSHGGQVANESLPVADFEENEFDDLAKEDGLEFHETGANSGDEDGDPDPDKKKNDLASRAMAKRKAKKSD